MIISSRSMHSLILQQDPVGFAVGDISDNGLLVYRGAKGVMPDRGQSNKDMVTHSLVPQASLVTLCVAVLAIASTNKIRSPLTGLVIYSC